MIDKFIWDMTYACPLRCTHCYSESGRRPAETPSAGDLSRIVDVILRSGARRVSLSGGEPLLVTGWHDAARRLRDAGVEVTLFASGWMMDEDTARKLAQSVTAVCVSVDGSTESTHDAMRGRSGSFRRAMTALEILGHFKRERAARGEECYALFVDHTVVRSNLHEVDRVVQVVTTACAEVDELRIGMAIPDGLAADEDFAAREILREEEMLALHAAEGRLSALASHGVRVSVTDMRYFIPYSPYGSPGAKIAHIEPDGQLRAFGVYEVKVGSVLEEPLDMLWEKALAWREQAFVREQIASIQSPQDWARVARVLRMRFGSHADKQRVILRTRRSAPVQAALG